LFIPGAQENGQAGNRGHQVTYTAILECREGEGPTQVEQGGGVLYHCRGIGLQSRSAGVRRRSKLVRARVRR